MSDLIPLWNLQPSRFQPRAPHFDAEKLLELAQSIEENGLINPILVFTYDDADSYMVWELIAGERRSRACAALSLAELFPQHTLADWCARLANVGLRGMGDEERQALRQAQATIPATVHPGGDLRAIHQIAVIENLDRADLSPIEEAHAFQSLIDAYGWSQRELAARLNKSQGYIAQCVGLLKLNAQGAEALRTRVINRTHARALAAVPAALQAAATEYVVAEVQKDDTPATTRQIENQLRALSAFIDPARWEPNGERVYTPQARNRLAVIKMLVSGTYAADRIAQAWGDLRLHRDMYNGEKNLLTAKPLTIVEDTRLYTSVVGALGMRTQDAWQNYAHLAQKSCATCIFANAQRPMTPGLATHCPRWKKDYAELQTCEGHINAAGPVIIPVGEYYVREQFGKTGVLVQEPFPHTESLAAYLAAYEAATNYLIEREAQKHEAAVNGPRDAIAEFWAWQQTLPAAALNHSQAHACVTCRYYEPLNGDAPCRFALNPLTQWDRPRALKFGVLYDAALHALPRCEMFTRTGIPGPLFVQPGFSVGRKNRRGFLNWMTAARKSFSSFGYRAEKSCLWRGPFAWCDTGDKYSWDDIVGHFYKKWDQIEDGGMATLFDALILEMRAGITHTGEIALLNLENGQPETWMPVPFAERNKEQEGWPDGWQRPWMSKPLIEVFDSQL